MAFLDNSGDIILDAVLTDTGRMRLARGDGSFKIAKFALGDDEINYATFNANHSSGSAYYDLDVLQTPVLEAFTNNTSTMKSKLISLSNTNLLYLPKLVLNEKDPNTEMNQFTDINYGSGSFIVLVDTDTVEDYEQSTWGRGVMNGVTPGTVPNARGRVDQGLHTTEISADFKLDTALTETQYIIEMDDRLGKLITPDDDNPVQVPVSFVDDDSIASYFVSKAAAGTGASMIKDGKTGELSKSPGEVIAGPRGTSFHFRIKASMELNSSTFLFTQIGSTVTGPASAPYYYIDTTIRITGATTGYRIDIPIRYLKKQ